MRKSLLACIAISCSSIAGPALAADMAVKSYPAAPAFSWTSCYLGAQLGGGWASNSVTDPVLLAQDDTIGGIGTTVGTTTSNVSGSGVLVGGQIGCDYQFAGNWVVGVQGDVAGTTVKGSTTVGLPQGLAGDSATFSARTDFLPSTTARLGYAFDRVLVYVKGGAAFAGEKYTETGSFQGQPFGFEGLNTQTGWIVGGGLEWAFYRSWSASLEYDYYSFGNSNIIMTDSINGFNGSVNVKQDIQVVKAGVNFHLWAQ